MKATILFIFIWIGLCGPQLPAQSPYKFNNPQVYASTGLGISLIGVSMVIDKKVEPLTPEELAALNALDVWGIDRWVTRRWSLPAQATSDLLLTSSLALPTTLLIDNPSRQYFDQVGLMTLEGLVLTTGLTSFAKTLFRRPRPFLYNLLIDSNLKVSRNSRYSFFSGHTSLTATMSFMTAKMHNDFYPDSKASPYVWASAAALPALVGYLRIKGGKHYLSDVLVGYTIGALVGILVPELHK